MQDINVCFIFVFFFFFFFSDILQLQYFLDTIEHLVCRKMCSKNFENLSTNIKVLVKNIFEVISCTKISVKEGEYFPVKILNSHYFMIIAQNHYKMTQMTYVSETKSS